ncbi:MAG: hypothetical protein SFU86_14900 [Pirellulaceae bacterium]|nr:hypothetical protein [Pirellulaceae bacterium]
MKIEENCGGGDTVIVYPKDALARVPASHTELLTSPVREAFLDPAAYFRRIAARCRIASMRQWLEQLVRKNRWELRLHTNGHDCPGIAAFAFHAPSITTAEIAPPRAESLERNFPAEIVEFYSLVDWVHWSIYGGAGGIERGGAQTAIGDFGQPCVGAKIDIEQTNLLGSTGGGDMFIYTADGRGGMLCHENLHVHLIGTIGETLEWMFQELLENREPEFDYNAWMRH